jgi:hypothetical protein
MVFLEATEDPQSNTASLHLVRMLLAASSSMFHIRARRKL